MRYPNGKTYRRVKQTAKGNKYHSRKVTVDGITFDSKLEARYWCYVKRQFEHNDDVVIKYHERFTILDGFVINGHKQRACVYTPDFTIYDDGKLAKVVDCKGGRATMTDASRLRMKMFMARYKVAVTIAMEEKGRFVEVEK